MADEQVTFTDDEGEEITKEELNQEIETLCDEGREAELTEQPGENFKPEIPQDVEPVKPVIEYSANLIRELRSIDIKGVTRTCRKCARRLPVAKIPNNDICEDCK